MEKWREKKMEIFTISIYLIVITGNSYADIQFSRVKQSYQKHNFPVEKSSISNESLRRTVDNVNK